MNEYLSASKEVILCNENYRAGLDEAEAEGSLPKRKHTLITPSSRQAIIFSVSIRV